MGGGCSNLMRHGALATDVKPSRALNSTLPFVVISMCNGVITMCYYLVGHTCMHRAQGLDY